MKAIALQRYLPIDHPESLLDVELPTPRPQGRELLVRVKAISVNPVDVKVRAPKDRIEEEPRVLGWDAAGIVEAVGDEVTLFRAGDEVYYAGSIRKPGTNSEFHLVDERIVGFKPRTLGFAEAAALPLTTITAWEALFERLGLDPEGNHAGQSILIVGGAGGVGSIAIQLAREAGLVVLATASRPESQQWVRQLGADHVIDHRQAFLPQLKALGFTGVHHILCTNDTEGHWQNMAEAILPQGKICSIVETQGPLDLNLLKNKSATFVWEFMFTRSMFNTPDIQVQHGLLTRFARWVDEGRVRTTVTETLSPINAQNLKAAHARIETGQTIGKIVLKDF